MATGSAWKMIVPPSVKVSPGLRDVLTTGVTSVITVVCILLVIRILATGLGPQEFGAYMLSRRVVTILIAVVTLSQGTALVRYLGLHLGEFQKEKAYIIGAGLVVGVPTLVTAVVLWGFAETFTNLLFRNPTYETLVRAIAFMLVGYSAYALVYALHRGRQQIRFANMWQLCIISIGPLILAIVFGQDADASHVVFLFGGLAFLVLPFLAWKFANSVRGVFKYLSGATRELVSFGAPRVPAGFALTGLISSGPLIAPHLGGLEDAALLAVGIAVFRVVEVPFAVFGVVALPRVAYYFGSGNQALIRESVGDLLAFLFHAGLFATLHLWLWSDIIIRFWLGEEYGGAVVYMKIYMLALIPYLSYVLLRSVADAITVKPVNTLAALLALVVGLSVAGVLSLTAVGVTGLAMATVAGLITLGSVMTIYVWYVLRFNLGVLLIKRVILLNIGILLLAWVLKEVWPTREVMSLVKLIVLEGVITVAYVALLRWWRVGWIEQIWMRIKVSRGQESIDV